MGLITTIEKDLTSVKKPAYRISKICDLEESNCRNVINGKTKPFIPLIKTFMENEIIPNRIIQLDDLIEQIYETGETNKRISELTGIGYSTIWAVMAKTTQPTLKLLKAFEKSGLILVN